jgi:hypothetical protein
VSAPQAAFREDLLQAMERKVHWAWPAFTTGLVKKDRLHIHLEQEYATYVLDFPRLVGRAFVQCEVAEVRRALAENLFEEETGGLVAGRPHPELFLEYPRGLGFDMRRFEHIELLPEAAAYRKFLDHATGAQGWEVAHAVVTLFVEGTAYERGELDPKARRRPAPPLEDHPLVKHYGLPLAHLSLTRAHRLVEGTHRLGAWQSVLQHVAENKYTAVVQALNAAVDAWLHYRDGVAAACGLQKSAQGPISV